jgi:hypothetical protein
MKRAMTYGIALAGAFTLAGFAVNYRPLAYQRPASACRDWGCA